MTLTIQNCSISLLIAVALIAYVIFIGFATFDWLRLQRKIRRFQVEPMQQTQEGEP